MVCEKCGEKIKPFEIGDEILVKGKITEFIRDTGVDDVVIEVDDKNWGNYREIRVPTSSLKHERSE